MAITEPNLIAFTLISGDQSVANQLIDRWAMPDDWALATSRRRYGAQRSLLARAGLRALLKARLDLDNCAFRVDAKGKLFVESSSGELGPDVCLSHSRGAVACALSIVGAIGVDVEVHRPRPYAAIAGYAFGPHERVLVERGGLGAFYRIWTLREAMAKATGDGLALATDGKDRTQEGPCEGCWTSSQGTQRWLLSHYYSYPGLSLSIAVLARRNVEWSPDSLVRVNVAELVP